ncbi:basic helix-loop-helix DNA-binding superfamily protein [Perilla frutescens var. hirtella]|uniref:Basic helix-loop-helix DNA-binding superfamily protein n=1 Tax=Perilla frutescens var. hirtella TaxID=608512 RepID=A0AAD4PBQ6_PERFH|nr:basic helix-loop-helix DNA-binding superfamily protein [Perilla frutescens var. hirtella]
MNSSSMDFLNNIASFEGYIWNVHGITSLSNDQFFDHHHQLCYDDQILRSIGPNVPVFNPTLMSHFFPSGHGCSTVLEPKITVMKSSPSASGLHKLRREKINDRLKCLQDLVPGCYKTMGMAVMLDVIINYLRSLQNQIDLSAASLVYDFNSSEAEAMEALQGTTGYEIAQVLEKLFGDGYGGIFQFQTAAKWSL